MIIGHRGASAVAPENTLAAFSRAISDGADGVEFDVRLSRDGVPVVIHDASLRRTGLRAGFVAEMTAAELARVDVGSWFNRARPAMSQEEYSGQRVSTLAEVFQLFTSGGQRFEQARLYVEVKTDRAKSTAAELAGRVADLILEYKLRERVVVLTFDLKMLAHVKQANADVRTGALFQPRVSQPLKFFKRRELISIVTATGANEIALHRSLATHGRVAAAVEAGVDVIVWTVNNPQWIVRTSKWGVSAVITDNPAALLSRP